MSDDAADAIAVIDGNRARDAAIIHDASTVERMTKALWEFMNSKKFKDAAAARLTTAHSDYAMYTGSPIETADLAAKLCDVARAAEKLIHPDKKGRPDVQNEALNALLQVPALYTPANIANRSFDPNGHTFVTEILAKILTYTKTHYEDAYRAAYNSSTGSNTLTAEARKTALLQVASIFDLGPKSAEFRIELIRGLVGTTNPTLTAEGTALVESLAKSAKYASIADALDEAAKRNPEASEVATFSRSLVNDTRELFRIYLNYGDISQQKIADLTASIGQNDSTLTSLEANIANADNELNLLDGKDKQFTDLRTRFSQAAQEEQIAKDRLATIPGKISALYEGIEDLKLQKSSQADLLLQAQETLETLNAAVTEQKTKRERNSKAISRLESRISDLTRESEKPEVVGEALENVRNDIKLNESRLDRRRQHDNGFDLNIRALETRIQRAQDVISSVSAWSDDITRTSAEKAAVLAEADKLYRSLPTSCQIGSSGDTVQDLENLATTIHTRIKKIPDEIKLLQDQVDNVRANNAQLVAEKGDIEKAGRLAIKVCNKLEAVRHARFLQLAESNAQIIPALSEMEFKEALPPTKEIVLSNTPAYIQKNDKDPYWLALNAYFESKSQGTGSTADLSRAKLHAMMVFCGDTEKAAMDSIRESVRFAPHLFPISDPVDDIIFKPTEHAKPEAAVAIMAKLLVLADGGFDKDRDPALSPPNYIFKDANGGFRINRKEVTGLKEAQGRGATAFSYFSDEVSKLVAAFYTGLGFSKESTFNTEKNNGWWEEVVLYKGRRLIEKEAAGLPLTIPVAAIAVASGAGLIVAGATVLLGSVYAGKFLRQFEFTGRDRAVPLLGETRNDGTVPPCTIKGGYLSRLKYEVKQAFEDAKNPSTGKVKILSAIGAAFKTPFLPFAVASRAVSKLASNPVVAESAIYNPCPNNDKSNEAKEKKSRLGLVKGLFKGGLVVGGAVAGYGLPTAILGSTGVIPGAIGALIGASIVQGRLDSFSKGTKGRFGFGNLFKTALAGVVLVIGSTKSLPSLGKFTGLEVKTGEKEGLMVSGIRKIPLVGDWAADRLSGQSSGSKGVDSVELGKDGIKFEKKGDTAPEKSDSGGIKFEKKRADLSPEHFNKGTYASYANRDGASTHQERIQSNVPPEVKYR